MKHLLSLLAMIVFFCGHAQSAYQYEPNDQYPYGRPNPDAPSEIRDFEGMIGNCDCKSVSRISPTEWADTVRMSWTFKYIMNGWGVQDESLKSDGGYSGSIRQFNPDSSKWYVHYYTNKAATPVLSAWEGNLGEDGDIVLYNEQKAPNGMEGYFRITFKDITPTGFNWLGEWVDKSESIIYPTWRIFCRKSEKE